MNHYPIDFYIFESGIKRENQTVVSCELPIVPQVGNEVVIDIDEKTCIYTVKKVKIYTMFSNVEIEVVIKEGND